MRLTDLVQWGLQLGVGASTGGIVGLLVVTGVQLGPDILSGCRTELAYLLKWEWTIDCPPLRGMLDGGLLGDQRTFASEDRRISGEPAMLGAVVGGAIGALLAWLTRVGKTAASKPPASTQ